MLLIQIMLPVIPITVSKQSIKDNVDSTHGNLAQLLSSGIMAGWAEFWMY